MFQTVAVPLWLLTLILLFAAVTFLSHFLFPSVRWFFRRRMERIVGELNKRLDRPIQPFKLMERNDMIVRLVHDPKVMEAVVAEAAEAGEPESVVLERAKRYAREIVPAFSASVYFGFATRAARWLARLIYKVRIGQFDADELRAIDKTATVVFVMNHRSNMDYVLVTYLAASRSALSYAVGEWARIWPLSWLIRSSGAYFIRRRSNNALYRRVLARYVQMATEEGVTQAIFPEGGLSLDGRVGEPRLGILSYVVQAWRPGGRDVVFIPVALTYDRVLEDRVLVEAAAAGTRKFRASPLAIFRFFMRNLGRKLRGRFKPFGYAAVSFGTPVSLAAIMGQGEDGATERLAEEVMARIKGVMPVLPVPLCAAVLEARGDSDIATVISDATALLERLEADGHASALPGGGAEDAVRVGVDALALRRIVRVERQRVIVPEWNRALIAYYAAGIRQATDASAARRHARKRNKRTSRPDPVQ
jgi:glycerol-3-phosphate O-acyltransferase